MDALPVLQLSPVCGCSLRDIAVLCLSLTPFLCSVAVASVQPGRVHSLAQATALYSWVKLNYTWTPSHSHQEYKSKGWFVPEHNIISGVKVYKGEVFVTVPRWLTGVPATVNKVVPDPQRPGHHLLQPYPSWEMQDYTKPSGLWFVQSIEIDNDGVMWILDVGRLNIFENDKSLITNGAPKLVLWDMNADRVLHTYVFPDAIVHWNSNFLNDLVVDQTRGMVYIADASAPGAVIVYSRRTNTARRYNGSSTRNNPSVSFTINGVNYGNDTFRSPVDGIALSADTETFYYCALQGDTLYSLPTAALSNFELSDQDISAQVTRYPGKKIPSGGMAFSDNNKLYFGGLTTDSVYQWDVATPFTTANQQVLAYNYTGLQWQDSFAFDGRGNLVFTVNRLNLFFTHTLDWSGRSGPTMQIYSVPINGNSYLAHQAPYTPQASSHARGAGAGVSPGAAAAIAVACFVVGMLTTALYYRKQPSSSPTHSGGGYMNMNN